MEKANMAVKLDGELRERLQALGKARQRTPHWLMREAIRLYVEEQEQVEKGKAEAREALAHYDATGEHVADEEMVAWLESWGTKRELPVPPLRRARRAR
jgi:predicted transcriptional regulator